MNHRKFIAFVAAAALAVAGLGYSTAPAQAGSDTARVITGIAAGTILGAAIATGGRGHGGYYGGHRSYYGGHGGYYGGHRSYYGGHRYQGRHYRPRIYHQPRVNHGGHDSGHSGGNDYNSVTRGHSLPGACRVQAGSRYGYSGNCLSSSYADYDSLPQQCAVRIGGQHGTVYRDSCLSGYGYSVGR